MNKIVSWLIKRNNKKVDIGGSRCFRFKPRKFLTKTKIFDIIIIEKIKNKERKSGNVNDNLCFNH